MKLLFLTIATALLFLSCNKSHNTGTNYYISCTLDGVGKNFAGNVTATRTADVTGSSLNINGLFSQTSSEGIDILIGSNNPNQPIGVGTYVDTSTASRVILTYAPSLTATNYSGSNATSDSAAHHFITISHVTVVITAVAPGDVQGTFSGDVFLSGNVFSDRKTVLNGVFDAKF